MKYELCKVADVPDSGSKIVPFFGREAHVYRHGGMLRAAANVCLHFGGPLECQGDRLMFLSTKTEGDALFYVWGE